MPWNPMESNFIPRNWNGSGIENLKISGSGIESEQKFENSVELELKSMESELKIQNFSITLMKHNQKYVIIFNFVKL